MAGTGAYQNFYFDPEIFTEYMQEQSCLNDKILASGIMIADPIIKEAIGNRGNVGTTPFFSSIDNETDALNDDGGTNNTPTALQGKKQTFMAIARMKAWKENTYVRYLTGKSPLNNLANNLVVPYWTHQWTLELMAILKGVMGVSAMASHKTNLSITSGSITDANKIDLTTHIDLAQKALGDNRGNFKLFICHSAVATRLKKLELTSNIIYVNPVTQEQISLPSLNGMILLETDTGTVDTSVSNYPVYHSYMVGTGAILYAEKEVHVPYGTNYDHETDGGVEKLYTKQARVMHPNGFSINISNIAGESPTRAELATSSNWSLQLNHKAVAIAEIVSNG